MAKEDKNNKAKPKDKEVKKKPQQAEKEEKEAKKKPTEKEAKKDKTPTPTSPTSESPKKTDANEASTKPAETSPETPAQNGNEKRKSSLEKMKPKANVILTYFNGTGRAELCRLIMAHAGIDYEDRRIDSEEWLKIKPDTPFSQLPLLEYHGEVLGQSLAMARFLAKKTGLYGNDELEQCRVDAIVDYVNDYNNKWISVFRADSYEEQLFHIKNIFINFLPMFFGNLQKLLTSSEGKYFTGEQLTYADLAVFQIIYNFTNPKDPFLSTLPGLEMRDEVLQDFPELLAHKDRVFALPNIKNWMENRPEGLF